MKKLSGIAMSLFLICSSAFADQKTIEWEFMSAKGSCKNRLKFDLKKYPEDTLRNTIHLIFGPEDINPALPVVGTNFRPESYLKFDFDKYAMSCTNALARANELTFVPLDGIDDYRRFLIEEIERDVQSLRCCDRRSGSL